MRRIIPRDLIKHMEWQPGVVIPEAPIPPASVPPRSVKAGIESDDRFWSIPGVQYRGETHRVDLMKTLLEGGVSKTQDQWAVEYQSAREREDFHTPDYPLFYGVVKALRDASLDPEQVEKAAEAQKFLRDTSRNRWLMTLTRISYQPSGRDIVIHNHGTSDRSEIVTSFVGGDGLIKDLGPGEEYRALLGTKDDVGQIREVFKYLNGTETYIWRVNNKPKEVIERVARFGADSDRADLDCVRNASDSYASLGVKIASE